MAVGISRRTALSAAGATAVLPTAAAALQLPQGKARSCIFIWLGGGAAQIDTWDPKAIGDPAQGSRKPGSAYPSIPTAIRDVQICSHLPAMAARLDRACLIRSVTHDVIDEHAAAVNRMHIGRPPTGTTVYPSIGSIVSHELGDPLSKVPAYVVMGYPSATRGSGFLGAKHNYIYLIDTASGPAGLRRPTDVTATRLERRQRMLHGMRGRFRSRYSGFRDVEDYVDAGIQGEALAGPQFASVFDLQQESADLRTAYGSEFGQRCLLARRLVERGVRFIQVYSGGAHNDDNWDAHSDLKKNHDYHALNTDQPIAALLKDLKQRNLLDETLVVWGGEFGRQPTAEYAEGTGRDHNSYGFTMWMAGGGIRGGVSVGTTDELGSAAVEDPFHVKRLHATVLHQLGIDPNRLSYFHSGLDQKLVGVEPVEPIRQIIS